MDRRSAELLKRLPRTALDSSPAVVRAFCLDGAGLWEVQAPAIAATAELLRGIAARRLQPVGEIRAIVGEALPIWRPIRATPRQAQRLLKLIA